MLPKPSKFQRRGFKPITLILMILERHIQEDSFQRIITPAQRASIASQCCSPVEPLSLRNGFLRGGLKGNDQKKYTLEVTTVKARKSDGMV